MGDVRFPIMLTRQNDPGSSINIYDFYELQKTMMNELNVSYGYVSMCDANEIIGTFRRRGYRVKSVQYFNFDEDET